MATSSQPQAAAVAPRSNLERAGCFGRTCLAFGMADLFRFVLAGTTCR